MHEQMIEIESFMPDWKLIQLICTFVIRGINIIQIQITIRNRCEAKLFDSSSISTVLTNYKK